MKKLLMWIKALFVRLFRRQDSKNTSNNIKILPENVSYIDWIDSVERQVQQVRIDHALGWIDEETYQNHMLAFQEKVKEISDSYLNYLRVNNITPISEDLVLAE